MRKSFGVRTWIMLMALSGPLFLIPSNVSAGRFFLIMAFIEIAMIISYECGIIEGRIEGGQDNEKNSNRP